MKKLLSCFIVFFVMYSLAQDVNSNAEEDPVRLVEKQMQTLVEAINASDSVVLSSIIADNATEAVKAIPVKLKGNTINYTTGALFYNLVDSQYSRDNQLNVQQVEVTWKVSSQSTGPNGDVSISGFSHNATFEKQGDTWKIIDGNFDPTSLGSIGWMFGLVFAILGLIFIPLVILWILMLIHAAKHDIHNKTTWIILMCLIGIPVSIIYFFTERKRFNQTGAIAPAVPPSVV